ncbi:YopX family protein [Listeria monocytogenes]
MRVIEFRAWDKEVKEMDYNPSVIEIWQNKPINEQFRLESEEKLVWMQYTGLKDKNGKKIFEGDIVNCKFFDRMVGDIAGVINFIDCVWAVSDFKNKRLYQLIDVDNIEIIGNIHENPELLEEK